MANNSQLWWINIIRGVAALLFGIMMLVWPAASIYIVALLFASFLLIFGISDIVNGIFGVGIHGIGSIARLLLGLLEAGSGAYLLYHAGSGLTLKVMGLLIAVNLIMFAIVNFIFVFIEKYEEGYRWLIALMAFFTLLIGIAVAKDPAAAAVTLIWLFGVLGIFLGPMEIALGIYTKHHGDNDRPAYS